MRLRLIERSETPDFLLVSSFQGWSTFQSASNTATTFHRTKTNTSIFILAQRYNRRRSTPQLMNCTNIYTADTSIFILTQRYQEIFVLYRSALELMNCTGADGSSNTDPTPVTIHTGADAFIFILTQRYQEIFVL